MKKPIKASVTAVLLWSVAIVPAATVTYMATADMAFAKSDNAGGKGNGNGGNSGNAGKSSNAGGKSASSSSSASSKGSGGGKSATRASGSDPVGRVLDRVLGRDKKAARIKTTGKKSAPAKSATVVARSKAPKARAKADPMHPSNLGNMNGALNANVNAVLAHIKNGNTNGPVGHMAALAVANVNAEGAQEVIDLKQDFVDLEIALEGTGYATVEEYYEALAGVDPVVITEIDDLITALDDSQESQDALDLALLENGYTDDNALADYETDRAGVAGIDEITEINEAIKALGGNVAEGVDVAFDEPSEDEVAGANMDLAAQDGAELAILDYWNKNTDTDPAISEEEQALLDKLNERLDAEAEAISAAVGTDEPVIDDEGVIDGAECEADDESCGPLAEEEIAAAE